MSKNKHKPSQVEAPAVPLDVTPVEPVNLEPGNLVCDSTADTSVDLPIEFVDTAAVGEEAALPPKVIHSPSLIEREEPADSREEQAVVAKEAVAAPLAKGLRQLKEAVADMDEEERELLDWLAAHPEHEGDYRKAIEALAVITNRRQKLTGGWRALDG